MKFRGMFKEYMELVRNGNKWIKKYWLAYVLICILIYALMFLTVYIWTIRDAIAEKYDEIKNKFFKKDQDLEA